MALMELFYRYCENNAEENVVIENKESSGEEAKVDPHQENDREKLEEADFPKRESEQHKESSQPPPKRHNSISEWENHMRQAEISKDIDRFKELNSMVSKFTCKFSVVILHRHDYLFTLKLKICKA